MTRIRHDRRTQERRKAEGQFFATPGAAPLKPLGPNQVRCLLCECPASLTLRGNLRPHRDAGGEECPNRRHEAELDLSLEELHERAEAIRIANDRPAVRASDSSDNRTLKRKGSCYECGRPVSGERLYCGQCLRRRT